ncbi:MAG TPA: response regulator [candidate division Zixibacteria bacterium]|nr:response regulator [candidate division Zixibacteria bacterium]
MSTDNSDPDIPRRLAIHRGPENEIHSRQSASSSRILKILLIEDEESHAALALEGFAVQSERFQVEVVSSLAQARSSLTEFNPDLVICDLMLPDGRATDFLSGSDIAYRLPVVVMTSQGTEQAAVEILKLGAINYVVKSVATLTGLYRVADDAMQEWNTKFVCRGPAGGHIDCALKGQMDRLRQDVQMTRGELQTQRLINRSLQQQVVHLRTTLELANLAAAWIDSDGQVVFVSDKMLDRLGPEVDAARISDVENLSPDLNLMHWPDQWEKLRHYRILAVKLTLGSRKEKVSATASLISTELGEFCFLQITDRPTVLEEQPAISGGRVVAVETN